MLLNLDEMITKVMIMNCQDHLYRQLDPRLVSRRWFFQECGVGLGAIALSQLPGISANAAAEKQAAAEPAGSKQPHTNPRRSA